MLSLQPSVVTTNEGGTGLGYSKIRVRGSDPTRMNITLNGISYNDAESQEVFWVNIPGLGNVLGSVQLQRGLGTSANGAGAFGASVNMSTAYVSPDPFSSIEMNSGSLGHGLPVSVGIALGNRMSGRDNRVYVVMGDGEMAEGSIWEAFMSGAMYRLDHLCAVIDRNHLQISGNTEDVMAHGALADKIRAFGWHVIELADGNDLDQLNDAFFDLLREKCLKAQEKGIYLGIMLAVSRLEGMDEIIDGLLILAFLIERMPPLGIVVPRRQPTVVVSTNGARKAEGEQQCQKESVHHLVNYFRVQK